MDSKNDGQRLVVLPVLPAGRTDWTVRNAGITADLETMVIGHYILSISLQLTNTKIFPKLDKP